MYQAQGLDLPPKELDALSMKCAQQMNNMDNRMRYRDALFDHYEFPTGLKVGELDDPTERELDAE